MSLTNMDGTRPIIIDDMRAMRALLDPEGLFASAPCDRSAAAIVAQTAIPPSRAATSPVKKMARSSAPKEIKFKLPQVLSHALEEHIDPEDIAEMNRSVAAVMARISASKKY